MCLCAPACVRVFVFVCVCVYSVVDGGMTALIPPVPSRHRTHPHSHIVKVSCFPKAVIPYVPVLNRKEAMKGLALAPDLFHRAWPYTPQQTLQ